MTAPIDLAPPPRVEIPARPVSTVSNSAPRPSPEPPATILLVEDDPSVASAIVSGLSRHQVQPVRSGAEALATLAQKSFDLVLLDLRLPQMDGLEVLRAIKADARIKHLPVVVITAHGAIEEKVRAFELGAHDYITKPFILAELKARIQAAARAKRMHDVLMARTREFEAARDAAEESVRSKTDFVANMSHEIRTPMNGVIAMTGLLQGTSLTAEQRDYLGTIRTSGEALLRIIDDILNISKIKSGKLELEQRPFTLRECLEGAIDVLAPKSAEKGLALACELEPTVVDAVLGDEARLRQVLINLLGNAVKFTETGEVILTAKLADSTDLPGTAPGETPAQWVQFSVRDTGVGVAPHKLASLFEPFVQAESSTTREYGGTGLGLAISKGLTELMGGRMWAESAPGVGSTFHFTVPLAVALEPSPRPAHKIDAHIANQRLLLVLPNDSVAGIVARMVRAWGASCLLAHDLVSAAEQLQASRFDGVILDIRAGADAAFAQTIAAAKLPTLVLSLIGDKTGAAWAAPLARKQLLHSPVKPAALKTALSELLNSGASAPTPAAPAMPPPAASANGTLAQRLPLRVLVTDDNFINQKVASRLLQQLGYAADMAGNGLEALAALEKKSYDLIFMDVQMPGLDGLETTRRIREREQRDGLPPIKIVAMTANAMLGDRDKCLNAGMDDYLAKPVRPEALQAAIERAATTRSAAPKAAPVMAEETPTVAANGHSAPGAVATVTGEDAAALLDTERLVEFSGGSRTSLIEITDLYLTQTAEQLDRLATAMAANDAAAVVRLAHSSAGASGVCGILVMEPLFRETERLGKENRVGDTEPLLAELLRNFSLVRTALLNSRDNLPLS